MSDLKIVTPPEVPDPADAGRPALPVSVNDAALNRRDLDTIKRDLITVRKDYREIRDNMVVLTHQYSRAPSRSFFVTFGLLWLVLLTALLVIQPYINQVTSEIAGIFAHR